jgi:mannose-6-phosphate isomerase
MARERHKAYGKTEMWYVLESEEGSKIYTGFKDSISREIYLDALAAGNLAELLNVEIPEAGDVFFTPAGRIHSIGSGNILVEIQQTSDITYRIFDWNRTGYNGKPRELHTELAIDAIDFKATGKAKIVKEPVLNRTENLVKCDFFNTNLINFNDRIEKDYNLFDSFVIYICTDGEFMIRWDGNSEPVKKGETVLVPAMIKDVVLDPIMESRILEVFINTDTYQYKSNN